MKQTLYNTDLKYLKGVGPMRAKALAEHLDLHTLYDLLLYFPHRHIDRSRFYKIADFYGNEMPTLQVKGRFVSLRIEGEGIRRRLVGTFNDGSGLMEVVWFSKVDTIKNLYHTGKEYVLFGKPTVFNHNYSMSHPEVEEYHPERPPEGLQGIYSVPEVLKKRGFSSRWFKTILLNLLSHPIMATLEETLPTPIRNRNRFSTLAEAISAQHNPKDVRELQRSTERLKFEELFYLELNILRYSRNRQATVPGVMIKRIGEKFNDFYSKVLPFDLTGAQKRVLKEIRADMKSGKQMNRLLQGDVGSGKTLVAFMTLLMAVDNGFQGTLMAPTEILAQQHYASLKEWADEIGVRVGLLTGSTRKKERTAIHESLEDGTLDILVGTHALIEDDVRFRSLGVAVIDEQHRFGVAQRARLWKKAPIAPHVLVMTATPIPRTLAMTVYGDLVVSVIDELPPGRKPVETWLRSDANRGEVNRLIRKEISAGRQVYVVYPLVNDNEKLTLKSVNEGEQRMMESFPGVKVCVVHGKMKPSEKAYQMEQFVTGKAGIMVATTVIEVGVNVPNASVMVIENAERFGLSQLHQLRGRVGRGADKSYCILMSKDRVQGDTKKRLGIMVETTDGFLISEADMKLRGPGDMEGTQQSGIAFNLRIASLSRDGQILEHARNEAIYELDRDPATFTPEETSIYSREMKCRFAKSIDWSRIS